MKKQFLCLLIGGSLLAASCSRTPESKVTEYTSNVKGFLNAKNDEDGEPVYNVISLKSVTDDWDGKEDFSPNSGDEKLVKVEFSVQSTDMNTDIGMLEANLALFDATTKKTYPASMSLAVGPTFKGLASTYESGYAVFSIPVDAKLDNLYLGADAKNDRGLDLSKVKTDALLSLKKLEAPAESSIEVNESFEVEDIIFDLTKTYTFKSITYNVNDEKVKKYRAAYPGSESTVFVKLELDIENSSSSEKAWVSMPWLISEYGSGIPDSDAAFGERPSQVDPGKTSLVLYYRLHAGEKAIEFIGEDNRGEDYSLKL